MTDVLMRSRTAVEHRDQIMDLLGPTETIYNALEGNAQRIGTSTRAYGAILVTSTRLLMVSRRRRGRIDVQELGWNKVARSGMGHLGSRGFVLLQERGPGMKWQVDTGDSGDADDDLRLLAATIQEARDAYAQATSAEQTSKLEDKMGDLRKQRGF